jgi:Sulfotransferase domain
VTNISQIYCEPTITVLVPAAGRSGQTWLCYMLAHLLNARFIEPYCLLRGILHSGLPYILDLTHGDLPGRSLTSYSLVVKTHELPDPYLSLTRKIILIVRDPRDMVTSAWYRYYVMKTTGSDLEDDAQNLVLTDKPIKNNKTLKSRLWSLIYGNRTLAITLSARKWAIFSAAWRDLPFTHVVRYEDLLQRPYETMAEICRYLELPENPDQINDTLHKLSFKEITGRKPGQEQTKNISFRKGTVGDHKSKLSPFELQLISYFCKEEAKHYGYQL